MKLSTSLRSVALAAAAMLAACGGGSDGGPAVTNLGATNVAYGKTVTVTVSGSGLNSNLNAAIEPGCFTMTRGTSTSDTTQTFTCKIAAIGDLRVRVRTAEGAELASLRLDVPAPQVTMTATQGTATGTFVMELDPVKAPKTVDNFLTYVNTGTAPACYYKNSLFHRVIADFVVQAGGFTTGFKPVTGVGAPIVLESQNGLKNERGTVAMARTSDPNSATTQFYINVKDNTDLDYVDASNPGYAVFGKVISGMDAIDVLQKVPTTTRQAEENGQVQNFPNAPVTDVVITSCSQTR